MNDREKVHLYLTGDQLWATQCSTVPRCHVMDGVVHFDCIDRDEETEKKTPQVFFRFPPPSVSSFKTGEPHGKKRRCSRGVLCPAAVVLLVTLLQERVVTLRD